MAEHICINTTSLSVPAAKVKFSIDPAAVNDLELGEEVMLGARAVIKNVTSEYGMYIDMKSYSTMYSYYEMVGITFDETIINLITSAIAVMIVLFCLLPPGPSVLAVLNVLLADICILAWVPLTGLNLNAITSTCMVMSVGIAVDFSAHITHAFVETDGSLSGKERAARAVTKMGRSLTTSALTTFMSVLMLSTVTVPSNRMFFVMMSGVTLFGLVFGMLLLPTVLSFFNPGYEPPVVVFTPATPLKPGEGAEMLEKMRSRGVRRHHRKHHKQLSEEEGGEKKEGEESGKDGLKEKEKEKKEQKNEGLKELEMKKLRKEKEEENEEIKIEKGEEKAELKELEMKNISQEKSVEDAVKVDDSLDKQSADEHIETPENPPISESILGQEPSGEVKTLETFEQENQPPEYTEMPPASTDTLNEESHSTEENGAAATINESPAVSSPKEDAVASAKGEEQEEN